MVKSKNHVVIHSLDFLGIVIWPNFYFSWRNSIFQRLLLLQNVTDPFCITKNRGVEEFNESKSEREIVRRLEKRLGRGRHDVFSETMNGFGIQLWAIRKGKVKQRVIGRIIKFGKLYIPVVVSKKCMTRVIKFMPLNFVLVYLSPFLENLHRLRSIFVFLVFHNSLPEQFDRDRINILYTQWMNTGI